MSQFGPDDEGTSGYRVPPHNIEAEQALLGAVLINNKAYDRVGSFLRPEHFFEPLHGRIYEACEAMIGQARLATPVTLHHHFQNDAALAEIGGPQYLARLAGAATTIISADEYGRTIVETATRRQIIHIGADMQNRAYDAPIDDTPAAMIEEADAALTTLLIGGTQAQARLSSAGDAARRALDKAADAYQHQGAINRIGLTTGLPTLDDKLGPLEAGMQIIVAGATSMGKTALAQQICLNNGALGKRVAIFSMEMRDWQLVRRFLAQIANVSASRIRLGRFSEAEYHRLLEAQKLLDSYPIFIDDRRGLTVEQIGSRARAMKRHDGLDLMMVDYLQIISASNSKDRTDRQYAHISKMLRDLGGELDVPLLTLSQLKRDFAGRENKRPQIFDLKESGNIENDADAIIFPHREEYYLAKQTPEPGTDAHGKWQMQMDRWAGKAEIIIGKLREGEAGGAALVGFDGPLTLFHELDNPPLSAGQAAQEKENQEAMAL